MFKIIRGKQKLINKVCSMFLIITFISSGLSQFSYAQAQEAVLNLPSPGAYVSVTESFSPTLIRGINIIPGKQLTFDFLVAKGDENFNQDALNAEVNKLIKYFLASLTVPDKEKWVNLSPYEKNRIVPNILGKTEMGRDMLAQDYLLKQLTSSMMYPQNELGKRFWSTVYKKAQEKFGTTEIPMNTFNKIWIVPEHAKVYEHQKGAFIVKSYLKVMLEEDYVALEANRNSAEHGVGNIKKDELNVITGVSKDVIREILIPEIEKEVNEGKTFAALRQIYHSVILASWFKQALKESLLGKAYVDQGKTLGVETADRNINKKIYDQYVQAFQKGVFDIIKEEYDSKSQTVIPRKYFSGGENLADAAGIVKEEKINTENISQKDKASIVRIVKSLKNIVQVMVNFRRKNNYDERFDVDKFVEKLIAQGVSEEKLADVVVNTSTQEELQNIFLKNNWFQADEDFFKSKTNRVKFANFLKKLYLKIHSFSKNYVKPEYEDAKGYNQLIRINGTGENSILIHGNAHGAFVKGNGNNFVKELGKYVDEKNYMLLGENWGLLAMYNLHNAETSFIMRTRLLVSKYGHVPLSSTYKNIICTYYSLAIVLPYMFYFNLVYGNFLQMVLKNVEESKHIGLEWLYKTYVNQNVDKFGFRESLFSVRSILQAHYTMLIDKIWDYHRRNPKEDWETVAKNNMHLLTSYIREEKASELLKHITKYLEKIDTRDKTNEIIEKHPDIVEQIFVDYKIKLNGEEITKENYKDKLPKDVVLKLINTFVSHNTLDKKLTIPNDIPKKEIHLLVGTAHIREIAFFLKNPDLLDSVLKGLKDGKKIDWEDYKSKIYGESPSKSRKESPKDNAISLVKKNDKAILQQELTLDQMNNLISEKGYKGAYRFLGHGSKGQFKDVVEMERAVDGVVTEFNAKHGVGKWLLVFGGDPANEQKPDIGYLVKRVKEKYPEVPILAVQADEYKKWGVGDFVDYVYYYPTQKDVNRSILYGGYNEATGELLGASKFYLGQTFIQSGLKGVVSFGGGAIEKEEVAYALKKGLDVISYKIAPRNVPATGESFGVLDSWLDTHSVGWGWRLKRRDIPVRITVEQNKFAEGILEQLKKLSQTSGMDRIPALSDMKFLLNQWVDGSPNFTDEKMQELKLLLVGGEKRKFINYNQDEFHLALGEQKGDSAGLVNNKNPNDLTGVDFNPNIAKMDFEKKGFPKGVIEYFSKLQSQGVDITDEYAEKYSKDWPEKRLDNSPKQQELIKSEKELQFSDGLLYSGHRNLDSYIELGMVDSVANFNRVGYLYGGDCFFDSKKENNPGFLVISTKTFNQYLNDHSKAVLRTPGNRKKGNIEPWPFIKKSILNLNDIEEIWVSEETYKRYTKLIMQHNSNEINYKFIRNLRSLFSQNKIKKIKGLHHSEYKDVFKQSETLSDIIYNYIVQRNLLKEIPIFVLKNSVPKNFEEKAASDLSMRNIKGGIDFNPNIAKMDVEKKGSGIQSLVADKAMLAGFNIEKGLFVRIIQITPVKDVLSLIGL